MLMISEVYSIGINNMTSKINDFNLFQENILVKHFNPEDESYTIVFPEKIVNFNKLLKNEKSIKSDVAVIRTSKKETLNLLNTNDVQAENILKVYFSRYNFH